MISGFVIAVVLVVIKGIGEQAYSGSNSGLGLVVLVAIFFLAIAIHELGHLVAGWALGFHFRAISVGPFALCLEHGVLKIRLRRDIEALGYTGMDADRVSRMRRRMLICVAAGPAANFLSIPLTILLLDYLFPGFGGARAASSGTQFVVLSFLLGAVNLVPFGSRRLSSDGARIAMLLSSRERARRWISARAIASQHNRGVRPRLWRRTWLKAACSVEDVSADEFFEQLACIYICE